MDEQLESDILSALNFAGGAMKFGQLADTINRGVVEVRASLMSMQRRGIVENATHGVWAVTGTDTGATETAKKMAKKNPAISFIAQEVNEGRFVRPSQVAEKFGFTRERGRQLCVTAVRQGIGKGGPRGLVCPPDIAEIPKHRDIFPSEAMKQVDTYLATVSCARPYEVAKALGKTTGAVAHVLKNGLESGKYDRYVSGAYSLKGKYPTMADMLFPISGRLNYYVKRVTEILKAGHDLNQMHLSADLGIASSVIGRALSDMEAWGEVRWKGQGKWEYLAPVYAQPGLPNDAHEDIMNVVSDGQPWRVADIVDRVTIGETRVGHTLSSLVKKGYLAKISEGFYQMVKPWDGDNGDADEQGFEG